MILDSLLVSGITERLDFEYTFDSKLIARTSVYSAYNAIAGPIAPLFASGYRTNSYFV